jgi:hypothetical protein
MSVEPSRPEGEVKQSGRPPWCCALLLTASLAGSCAASYVSPATLYLQEGSLDSWFTREEAEALIAAAREPKHLVWYDAGHSLDEQANRDRLDWLAEALGSD